MLTLISDFLDGIPPIVKEAIMIVLGFLLLYGAWKGGPVRDKLFHVAA